MCFKSIHSKSVSRVHNFTYIWTVNICTQRSNTCPYWLISAFNFFFLFIKKKKQHRWYCYFYTWLMNYVPHLFLAKEVKWSLSQIPNYNHTHTHRKSPSMLYQSINLWHIPKTYVPMLNLEKTIKCSLLWKQPI